METTILYVLTMAVGVIVTFTICCAIGEFFEKRRELRIAAYVDMGYTKFLGDTADMSIDMIERINKRMLEQFSEDDP